MSAREPYILGGERNGLGRMGETAKKIVGGGRRYVKILGEGRNSVKWEKAGSMA